ncbi:MAG TPA: EamA family transporter, partial [Chitinophagaceae bacterium]|nr:EamA family transporter [Chitinophagaceae bacterium]
IRGHALPTGRQWRTILILTFLNFVLSNTMSTWGVKYISAGLGSIIAATFPLWLVVIAFVKSRSEVTKGAIPGFLIGFAGICIIFYEHLNDLKNPDFRLGITLSLLSTWSWAFGTLYIKKKAADFNPYFSLGLQMLFSSVVVLAVAYFSGKTIPVSEIPTRSWLSILYLIIFGSVISFVAYLYALQHLAASRVSTYAYINPIVAVMIGTLMFDEKFTLFIAIGGVVTLLGVYLVNQAFSSRRRRDQESQ